MIDISSMVFDTVYDAIIAVDQNADVMDVPAELIAKFPAVTVRETNNVPVQRTNTDDCSENYTRIAYEIRVYSDLQTGSKAEANKLLAAADTAMKGMKFYRTLKRDLPNQDRTIYVAYARYEVIVGKPYVINEGQQNEKTVYPMYRR